MGRTPLLSVWANAAAQREPKRYVLSNAKFGISHQLSPQISN
jgi:hypothetical protein